MFTKHEFVEYANTIRDYSNAMTEAGELLHIEFLESRFEYNKRRQRCQ